MIEKEALGITWACEKFFLVGRKFEVETDHKPLIALLGEKDLSQLHVRVQRFKMRLMRYDSVIKHTPGSQMYIADMLSRPNTGSEPSDNDLMQCRAIAKIAQVATDGLYLGLPKFPTSWGPRTGSARVSRPWREFSREL